MTEVDNAALVTPQEADQTFANGTGEAPDTQTELRLLAGAMDELREEVVRGVTDLRALADHAMGVLMGLDQADHELPGTQTLRTSLNQTLGVLDTSPQDKSE